MEVDEHLLPTERRVIRVRNHWVSIFKDMVLTGLFLLVMVAAQSYLASGPVVDNVTFYLSLAAVIRFSIIFCNNSALSTERCIGEITSWFNWRKGRSSSTTGALLIKIGAL